MHRTLGVGLVWLVTTGCTDLPDIARDVCGNGFVESQEDCDDSSASCGAPGTATACRFVCSAEVACPVGYRCGADAVCRSASGTFEFLGELVLEDPASAALADMDGDGILDLVTTAIEGGLRVSYLDARGSAASTFLLPSTFGSPAIGQLTASEAAAGALPRGDIVRESGGAINVFRGRSDRTLEPTSYASIPVPDAESTYLAIEAHPAQSGAFQGDEVLRLWDTEVRSVTDNVVLFSLPFHAGLLSGAVRADLDTRVAQGGELLSPWEEFVVARFGDTEVHVFSPTRWGAPGQTTWNHDPSLYAPIKLPSNYRVSGPPQLADVNEDGHLDLVIAAALISGGDTSVFAAYGLGDGTFHSDPTLPAAGDPADQGFQLIITGLNFAPLAVAHLNGDGALDFVLPDAIMLSGDGPTPCKTVDGYWCIAPASDSWNSALIGQFNDSGGLDIVAASVFSRSIEFFNGTGTGQFNRFAIPTKSFPSRLVAGDFDGDLLLDVAFAESDSSTYGPGGGIIGFPVGEGQPRDTISVLFGRAFGPPEPPVAIGQLGLIEALVVGRMDLGLADADAITDLGVLSADLDAEGQTRRSLALFRGATDRVLSSPFQLREGPEDEFPDVPTRTWIGRFTGKTQAGIGVLSFDFEVPTENGLRTWLLATTGEAELVGQSVGIGKALPSTFDWCTALAVNLDTNGDGRDELVFLGRKRDGDSLTTGALSILRAVGNPPAFEAEAVIDMPLVFSAPPIERLKCQLIQNLGKDDVQFDVNASGQLFAAEVDGEPGLDLVATGWDSEQLRVVILRRSGGVLDTTNPIVIDRIDGFPLAGVLPIQADRDAPTEYLLLSGIGVELAELDLSARRFVARRRIQTLDGGFVIGDAPSPRPRPGFSDWNGIGSLFHSISAAATGDIDGDGVDDFTFGYSGSFRIWRGREAR